MPCSHRPSQKSQVSSPAPVELRRQSHRRRSASSLVRSQPAAAPLITSMAMGAFVTVASYALTGERIFLILRARACHRRTGPRQLHRRIPAPRNPAGQPQGHSGFRSRLYGLGDPLRAPPRAHLFRARSDPRPRPIRFPWPSAAAPALPSTYATCSPGRSPCCFARCWRRLCPWPSAWLTLPIPDGGYFALMFDGPRGRLADPGPIRQRQDRRSSTRPTRCATASRASTP